MKATATTQATDSGSSGDVATATTATMPAVDLTHDRIVFRECPPEAEQRARAVWAEVRPRLTRHLKRLPQADLRFNLVVTRQKQSYEVRLTLALGSGTLTARAEDEQVDSAVGKAATRLERELTRHLTHLQKVDARRNLQQRRLDLDALAPTLAADRARGDEGAFVEALRPYLPRLRELARHELRIAMLEGRTTPGAVTVGDLLDALLLRFYQQYDRRPKDMPLDTWLVRLLHEVADETLGPSSDPATRQPIDAEQAQRVQVDGDGWVQELEPGWLDQRGIQVQDLLPDPSEAGDPEEFVETEELERQVLEALRDAPAVQRRAFMLAAFDGWNEQEIAMLLRRTPEQVRADIAAARERMRQRLAARSDTRGAAA
jgi:RNA polymerase sigma factor (sigma-70 family)